MNRHAQGGVWSSGPETRHLPRMEARMAEGRTSSGTARSGKGWASIRRDDPLTAHAGEPRHTGKWTLTGIEHLRADHALRDQARQARPTISTIVDGEASAKGDSDDQQHHQPRNRQPTSTTSRMMVSASLHNERTKPSVVPMNSPISPAKARCAR